MLLDSAVTVTLRTAARGDDALIRRLFTDSRAADFAHLPGTDAAAQAIVDLQFTAHAAMLSTRYPDAEHKVITAHGSPVGHIVTNTLPGSIRLVDIAVLAEHQGHGLGTAVLDALLSHADATVRTVELSVWELNEPAIRWYQRHNFITTGAVGGRLAMRRPAHLKQGIPA
ncbi:hypothetical protein GCM10022381_19390 [Leifsonia kafniensis]|uniref:N-acetyltransferase domain-containing protein n=1 Tax=Leifsonia kafniensis TaxID=475957 RepID=A0ABP7KH12_9MICO